MAEREPDYYTTYKELMRRTWTRGINRRTASGKKACERLERLDLIEPNMLQYAESTDAKLIERKQGELICKDPERLLRQVREIAQMNNRARGNPLKKRTVKY